MLGSWSLDGCGCNSSCLGGGACPPPPPPAIATLCSPAFFLLFSHSSNSNAYKTVTKPKTLLFKTFVNKTQNPNFSKECILSRICHQNPKISHSPKAILRIVCKCSETLTRRAKTHFKTRKANAKEAKEKERVREKSKNRAKSEKRTEINATALWKGICCINVFSFNYYFGMGFLGIQCAVHLLFLSLTQR